MSGSSPSAAPAVPASRVGRSAPPVRGVALVDALWNTNASAMVLLGADRLVLRANSAALASPVVPGLRVGRRLEHFERCVRSVRSGVPAREAAQEPVPVDPLALLRTGTVLPRTRVELRPGEDGVARSLQLSVIPVHAGGGLLVWDDLGATPGAEQEEPGELSRLGQLLDGASDYAIVMLDADGHVRSWSPAAERLHGYLTDEAIGLPYSSFFDAADRSAKIPESNLARADTVGKLAVEGKRINRDGSLFWAHETISATRDPWGRLQGYVLVSHDVSEQRALEQASQELTQLLETRVAERTLELEQKNADLAALNAELEAFSYSVSHDLRAPLRAMSGFARILAEDYAEQMPAEALNYLGKVTENAEHMGSLIDALLSFSRMQRQQLQVRQIDMAQLVQECWTALAPSRRGREIDFLVGPLPPAQGDLRLIRQVWMNLLDNAIKYTGKRANARVEVRAETAREDEALPPEGAFRDISETVMYLVKDNGAGFDMRYVAKVGQVFQRLHHQEEFSGTGIGLALSQRIIHRHGGQLSAVGEPGVGATMGFTLQSTGGDRS